jgi:hypothetical protein
VTTPLRVIGIDPSLFCTGVADVRSDGGLIGSWAIRPRHDLRKDEALVRSMDIAWQVGDVVACVMTEARDETLAVYCEQPMLWRSRSVAKKLDMLAGAIAMAIHVQSRRTITPAMLMPAQWRRLAGIPVKVGPLLWAQREIGRLGFSSPVEDLSEDELEAYGIGRAGIAELQAEEDGVDDGR